MKRETLQISAALAAFCLAAPLLKAQNSAPPSPAPAVPVRQLGSATRPFPKKPLPLWTQARTNAAKARVWAQPGSSSASASERTLVEVGPNSRTWTIVRKSGASTNGAPAGPSRAGAQQSAESPGAKVVEIATGMNYWDGQQWTPSDATFEAGDGAFVANRVLHRTRLNAEINVVGAVTTTLLDGTTLRSTPLAIGLYDPNDGRFAVMSTITNSTGVLVDSNQVLYADAFSGGICANVVYTLQQGSFSQDVVITGRLNPLDYGFPTNARIQVVTEFYNPPQPEKILRPIYIEQSASVRQRMVTPDFVDEVLGFSDLVISTGRAFTPPSPADTNGTQTIVAKEFRTVPEEGRTFLIESVNCPAIQKALNTLPECGTARTALHIHKRSRAYALLPHASQGTQAKAKPQKRPLQQAQAHILTRSGVVIDYFATLGGTLSGTQVFAADTTYLVDQTVCCNGPVVLEGAVFKYRTGTSIILNNTLTCKTSSYQPAVFTAIDDDSIGETCAGLSGYNGPSINPAGYANPALDSEWSSTPSLSNIRICYAQEALRLGGTSVNGTLAHAQFVRCIRGIVLAPSDGGSGSGSGGGITLTVNNALFSLVNYALVETGGSGSGPSVSAYMYQCTVDQSLALTTDEHYQYPSLAVTFKNSVLANITNVGNGYLSSSTYNGFYAAPLFGNSVSRWKLDPPATPFQASGGGAYYLRSDSVFRTKGATTGLPTTLLPSLKTRTTSPPIVFPHLLEITGALTLSPQVPRYVNGPPDLGYYYPVLDSTVAWLTSFGAITVLPGTVVGIRNEYAPEADIWTWWGFDLREGSSFTSYGRPEKPNIFTDVQLVQEQQPASSIASFLVDFFPNGVTPPPSMDFRFTEFYATEECYHFWGGFDEWYTDPRRALAASPDSLVNWTLRDCNLWSGHANLGLPDNGVFFGAPQDYVYGTGSVSWFNNSFHRVCINLDPSYYHSDLTTVNCDMQIQAYNNLFQGGTWFHIFPAPASAGNWTFKDNLFDKVDIVEETDAPLDYDYNAYWPMTQNELDAIYSVCPWRTANSAQLQPTTPDTDLNGGHEQTLTSAPPYQSGPYSDYYLALSSPLYNSANRGSRAVADAGLYHYTTRADQTKDGSQSGNAIIGRHYIATVSSTSTQPKDSDTGGGDGIPDYVENWHGDGIYHADTETQWQQNYTTSGVEDKNNALYLDLDLDGDGMVGRIETALSKNPLVPDNLLTLIPAASPGPNQVAFVVPVPFSTVAGIGSPSLRLDGSPVPFLRWDQDTSGGCLLTWDTTYEAPGDHCVQVELYLNGQTRPGAMGVTTTLTVTVDEAPYQYPALPGTAEWINTAPLDRVSIAQIPQEWQGSATSWELFCSAIGNPYFRVLWVPSTSMAACYNVARTGMLLPILSTVDSKPDFGANVLRYLGATDVATLASCGCPSRKPCIFEYIIVCHMASLDATMNTIDSDPLSRTAKLQRLFAMAVWDANQLISTSDDLPAVGPIQLMYAIYQKPEAFRGTLPVTLDPLTSDESTSLDQGDLPAELISTVQSAKIALGLTSRP